MQQDRDTLRSFVMDRMSLVRLRGITAMREGLAIQLLYQHGAGGVVILSCGIPGQRTLEIDLLVDTTDWGTLPTCFSKCWRTKGRATFLLIKITQNGGLNRA